MPKCDYEVSQIYATPRIGALFSSAEAESKRLQGEFIGTEHLLIAIADENRGDAATILHELGVDREKVYAVLQKRRSVRRVVDDRGVNKYRSLGKYGYDLTDMARQNKLESVVGIDSEVNQLIELLAKDTKRSPLLVGDSTVDTLSIVEGLAQRIAQGSVPDSLLQKKIVVLDLGKLTSGSKFRGEFEERLIAIVDEVERSKGEIIPYFDEIWFGATEGGLDIGSVLKYPLAFGKFRCIAATVPKYLELIGEKGLLVRQFQCITITGSGSVKDAANK